MRYSRGMAERKKILFIITKSSWGGAQRYVYDLATHLSAERFEVAVAAGGDGLLFDRLADAGIRAIRLTALQRDIAIGKEFTVLKELIRLFMRERPDIVHLNSSKIGGLGAVAAKIAARIIRRKIRVVFTAHGWGFYEDRPLAGRAAIFAASFIASLFQDTIITINTADFRAARRFIPARKLHLIFNGIAEIDFRARADARAIIAEKIGRPIPDTTLLIGAIAELTPNKGLVHLLDAIKRILHPAPPTTPLIRTNKRIEAEHSLICIIGEGEQKEFLQKQINSYHLRDHMALAGFIPDAEKYLAAFDIFVLPSLKEGLPYAVIEAMTAGLPVVATRVGGLPDIITSGKDGLLVPSKNPAMLANALAMLAHDPDVRARLGARAREKVRTRFRFRAMMDATIAVYI